MRIRFQQHADGDYRASELDKIGGIDHGFGTRCSGEPTYPTASAKQIHSTAVITVERSGFQGEGDALVTRTGGIAIGVRTADCVPVLMADPVRKAVAAVHAGWRGTAGAIVMHAVRALSEHYGSEPSDVVAAIGPAIGECCFEVGFEVAKELEPWAGNFSGPQKPKLNLEQINARQLVEAGVRENNISAAHLCTKCRGDLFHSFRRDREAAGRMLSWIAIRA